MDEEEETEKKEFDLAHRAEYSAFGSDLLMMVDLKRYVFNNLTIFDQYYIQEPRYGIIALECLYNFYRYPRSMLGNAPKKKEMDKRFQKLRERLWAYEINVGKKSRMLHIPAVRNRVKMEYREVRDELSTLIDDVIELAQKRGLGIPASAEISTVSKLRKAILR